MVGTIGDVAQIPEIPNSGHSIVYSPRCDTRYLKEGLTALITDLGPRMQYTDFIGT
jgi:hypothetical protein